MTIHSTNTFPSALMPGKYSYALQKIYQDTDFYWKKIFSVKKSRLKTEYGVVANTFGLAQPYTEGGKITYQSQSEGATISVQHTTYASGYIYTMEEDYFMVPEAKKELINSMSTDLLRAFGRTKEVVHMNILNRAFNTSYNYGDTTSLVSTSHTTNYGNQSNRLAVDADISETSLENLIIQIQQAQDNVGNQIGLMPRALVVPPSLMMEAERIVGSQLQNDTANNAINVIKAKRYVQEILVSPYLTDTDAFFLTTDVSEGKGFVHFDAIALHSAEEPLIDGFGTKVKMAETYSATCFDWRAVYGSAGA